MPLIADWSVRAEPVSLSKLSHMTNTNPVYVKQMYRSGDLGPAPDVSADVLNVPLYHATSFFVVQEARKKGIALDPLLDALPVIAGAAYIQFLLSEIRAGHCIQRGGTPSLNTQLWALLHAPGAKVELEQQLPGGAIETRRYACFRQSGTIFSEDLSELAEHNCPIVDAWAISARMKQSMPGTFLHTRIA